MALKLSDKNRALFLLSEAPADINNPKLADLAGARNVADRVFLNGTYFRSTDSEKITDPFLNGDPNEAFGQDNFEGAVNIARFFENGVPDPTDDYLFDAVKVKGTPVAWATRKGVAWDEELAAGQEISIFVCETDNPQEPQETSGYEKVSSPQAVKKAALYRTISA
nr:MAG TPA_asm: hypothetical protein [Caudoviricetes sp.]